MSERSPNSCSFVSSCLSVSAVRSNYCVHGEFPSLDIFFNPAALIGLSLSDSTNDEKRKTGEVFLLSLKTLLRVSFHSARRCLLASFCSIEDKDFCAFTPSSPFSSIKGTLSFGIFNCLVVKLNTSLVKCQELHLHTYDCVCRCSLVHRSNINGKGQTSSETETKPNLMASFSTSSSNT